MQYGFYFNSQRCTGCKTCMLACKDFHNLPVHISFRQIYEYGGGTWQRDAAGSFIQDCFTYYMSLSCNHCSEPVCVKVCPTGAMHKNEQGLVTVDTQRCIGCGYCALSCPYRAPKVNHEVGFSVKCDGCLARLDEGKRPICVEACPVRALDFDTIEKLLQRYEHTDSKNASSDIPPLPSAETTSPNLLIRAPQCYLDNPTNVRKAGSVLNIREIV